MVEISAAAATAVLGRVRTFFTTRHLVFHDGRSLRRESLGARRQAAIAAVATLTLGFSGYGVAQAAQGVAQASGVVAATGDAARIAHMEGQIDRMQARVTTINRVAQEHAQRIEQRQALLAAAVTGTGDAQKLALATLSIDPQAERLAASAIRPFATVEQRQVALAGEAQRLLDQRYATTIATVRKLGLNPKRVTKGVDAGRAMGGPMIAADSEEATADLRADQQFKSLFQTWKKLDTLQKGAIAIPSVLPVQHLSFTSNFGIRSDPFRGTAAMHAGVDIPGPTGTPIYATADGIISHADRLGGYGNMVEINHGKGIATRYGHLSKILVANNTRVTRGQLIALMGSTGRSTGPHLHYEVRIDGHAVNPVPFLTTADYLTAAQDRNVRAIPVSTGPAPLD